MFVTNFLLLYTRKITYVESLSVMRQTTIRRIIVNKANEPYLLSQPLVKASFLPKRSFALRELRESAKILMAGRASGYEIQKDDNFFNNL